MVEFFVVCMSQSPIEDGSSSSEETRRIVDDRDGQIERLQANEVGKFVKSESESLLGEVATCTASEVRYNVKLIHQPT